MEPQINMIGIITNQFEEMSNFYQNTLGFSPKLKLDAFIEFENKGVRFAISTGEVMAQATGDLTYSEKPKGHSFELAFDAKTPENVDKHYDSLIQKGAKPIKPPADMPWGQRTAFFADPDGNIHEIFSDIPSSSSLPNPS